MIGVIAALIVVNSDVYSKASNDGWLSFIGSMVGSFIAGIASVLLMLVNRKEMLQMQEERKRDERKKEVERIRDNLEEMYALIQINPKETLFQGNLVAIKTSKCIQNSPFLDKICEMENLMNNNSFDMVKSKNEELQKELYIFEE